MIRSKLNHQFRSQIWRLESFPKSFQSKFFVHTNHVLADQYMFGSRLPNPRTFQLKMSQINVKSFNENRPRKVYDLEKLKTNLSPEICSSDVEDIEDFSETVLSPDECLEKLKDFLILSNEQSSEPKCEKTMGPVHIRSWVNLSIEGNENYLELHRQYQDRDPKNVDDVYSFNDDVHRIAEELNVDLSPLLDWLRVYQKSLKFEELQACVLALSFWPPVMIFSQRVSTFSTALTKTQTQLYQLYELLEDASYKRLYIFSSKSPEFYLGDITSRIDLAKAWVHVIAENRVGKFNSFRNPNSRGFGSEATKCRGSSFPASLVRKCCDRTTSSSRRFFSKFSPEIFVDFARVLTQIRYLSENFHKYYYTYKFFEFMPFLNLSQASLICSAGMQHGLILTSRHPIGFNISNSLIKKMTDNIDQLSDFHLTPICGYLDLQSIMAEQLPSIIALQDAVAAHISSNQTQNLSSDNSSNRTQTLNVKSLINLCSISVHFGCSSPNLVKVLQESLKAFPNDENEFIYYKEVRKLIQLVQNDIFPAEQKSEMRNLCRALMLNTTSVLGSSASVLDKVLSELHLGYERVFDEKLLTEFFTDQRIFCRHKKDQEIALWPKYVYENAPRSTMIRTGVLYLQGLLEIHCPEYSGPKLSLNHFEQASSWMEVPSPSIHQKKGIEDVPSSWTLVGRSIQSILSKEFERRFDIYHQDAAQNYILETSVLPFFGLTDYVMVFDKDFRPIRIPSEFSNLRLGAIRRPISTEGGPTFWVSLTYCNPIRHALFSKAMSHPKDVFNEAMHKIGFHRVHKINLLDYKIELDNDEDDILEKKLEKDVLKVFEFVKSADHETRSTA